MYENLHKDVGKFTYTLLIFRFFMVAMRDSYS